MFNTLQGSLLQNILVINLRGGGGAGYVPFQEILELRGGGGGGGILPLGGRDPSAYHGIYVKMTIKEEKYSMQFS